MELKFVHLDKEYSIEVVKTGHEPCVTIDKTKYELSNFTVQDNIISFQIKDDLQNIYYAKTRDKIYLSIEGDAYVLVSDKGKKARRPGVAAEKADHVCSPMPGLLVKVAVCVDDKVKAGETLAVVEAMKMQNELRAPRDGIVKKIHYKEGEQVDAMKPIIELK